MMARMPERTSVRYRPAQGEDAWWIAARGDALAALSREVTPHTADAVWRRLGEGGIGAVLDALTAAFGTSLTAIPPFALVVAEEGGMRVAVRGTLELIVEAPGGSVAVSGEGVSTWSERFVSGAVRAALAPRGGAAAAEEAVVPLGSGVALADLAVLATASTPTAGPLPAPAPGAAVPDATEAPDGPGSAPLPGGPDAPEAPEAADAAEAPEAPEGPDAWASAASAETQVPAATIDPAASGADPAADEYDLLWGETVARPIAAAVAVDAGAVDEQPPSEPARTASTTPSVGDHDGETISVAEARALRAAEREQFESTDGVPPRRPARGRIVLSTGQVVELERPVVIGRRPRSTRTSGSDLPILIAVDSPDQDISRSHVEIRAEGEHVLVTDLDTTNGTLLRRGAQDPVRLHPGEPTMVVTGDVLDLGDGVTVLFEELP